EPLGPMMPSPCPASSLKAISWTTTFWTPGGAPLMPSTERRWVGGCSGIGAARAGSATSSLFRRAQAERAAVKPRQLAMARSTGASARGQDRAGDDDAGARLLVDHQIGADREHH